MLLIYKGLNFAYWIIYLWVVVMCIWNLFRQKDLWRQIACVMIIVPFLLRMLYIK